MGPLIKLLLPRLCAAASTSEQAQLQLMDLLHKAAIAKPELQAVGEGLLREGSKLQQQQQEDEADNESGAGLGRLRKVLQVLDARHAEELDAAINSLLKASKQQQEGGEGGVGPEAVFAFVQSCFRGSRHDVVGAGAAALTLAVAVNAPAEELRLMVSWALGMGFQNQMAMVTELLGHELGFVVVGWVFPKAQRVNYFLAVNADAS